MKRLILAAGVAALAITAPAASQPGDRGGKDRKEQVQKKRGEARAQRSERRQQRAQRVERRAQRADRPQRANRAERRAERAQRVERRAQRPERAQRVERPAERADRRAQRVERRAERPDRRQALERRVQRADRVERRQAVERRAQRLDVQDRRLDRIAERADRRVVRLDERRQRQIERINNRADRRLAGLAETRVIPASEWRDLARDGMWLDGCPPGLARKLVPCVPPGQVSNVVGQPLSILNDRVVLQDLPNRLRFVYADTPDYYYRYGNGYAYRVDRSNDLISALIPLFGLGLTVGQPFPTAYSNYYLPTGLQPFYAGGRCGYPYGSSDYYRYASGYVYEIDCRTGLVEDVDPLLGYGYGYGQMMPITYSAYNVPYAYRPFYYDTSDYYYRYAPGAIYQVDPTTSLITAVAALLTGGMTVGQPLPTGYNVYNVPYAYRTTYYDTPNAWYRYSNGSIYRVDPETLLVTALVASALT